MKERRRAPRVALKRGINWRGEDTFDNLDQGIDVSEGGVSFSFTSEKLSLDDLIQISFQLPTKKLVQAKARVRWTSTVQLPESIHRAGLEFVDINSPQRQEIRHFVGVCRYGCD